MSESLSNSGTFNASHCRCSLGLFSFYATISPTDEHIFYIWLPPLPNLKRRSADIVASCTEKWDLKPTKALNGYAGSNQLFGIGLKWHIHHPMLNCCRIIKPSHAVVLCILGNIWICRKLAVALLFEMLTSWQLVFRWYKKVNYTWMRYPVILSRVGSLATKDSLFQEMKEDGKIQQCESSSRNRQKSKVA